MILKIIDKHFILRENTVFVHIVSITIWIFKQIRTVQWIDTDSQWRPCALAISLPPIRERVSVGIDEIWIRYRPGCDRFGSFSKVFEQIAVQSCFTHKRPLVLTKICKSILVSIPCRIIGSSWIQGPVVPSIEGSANPSTMFNFPTIRHAITIGIHHGWICANIN